VDFIKVRTQFPEKKNEEH